MNRVHCHLFAESGEEVALILDFGSNAMTDRPESASIAALRDLVARRIRAGAELENVSWIDDYPEHAAELRRLAPTLRLLADYSAGFQRSARSGGAGDSLEGRRVAGYEVLREIGRGGMGVVYEAEDQRLARRVALKVLPAAALLHDGRRSRFENEARAAAGLRHPHIVPVFSVGEDAGIHYYAMQLIDGLDMARVLSCLRERRVPDASARVAEAEPQAGASSAAPLAAIGLPCSAAYFRVVARLGADVADALDYAHEHGIVHRDIKPSNLILDRSARIWVTDFGLAAQADHASQTATGELLGTLRYMSPEQAEGRRHVVGPRSDVYSLGVTLYELASLLPAHSGTSREALLRSVLERNPTPLSRVERAVPRDLETIVHKAIAGDPSDRYASARLLADDLRRFAADETIRARPTTPAERALRWARRHRSIVGGVGFTAAAAVAVLVFVLARFNAELRENAAILARHSRQLERTQDLQNVLLADEAVRTGDLDRARERLAATAGAGADPAELFDVRHLRRRLHLDVGTIHSPEGAIAGAAFLADSARLATFTVPAGTQRTHVAVWDVATRGAPAPWPVEVPLPCSDIAASPDGNTLALSASWTQAVATVDVRDGSVRVHEVGITGTQQAEFSPDGALVAFGSSAVYLVSPRLGRQVGKWTASGGRERSLLAFSASTGLLATGGGLSWSTWRLPPASKLERRFEDDAALAPEREDPEPGDAPALRMSPVDAGELPERLRAMTAGGDVVVTADESGGIALRRLPGFTPYAHARHPGGSLAALAVCRDGRWIATGGGDGRVALWTAEPLAHVWSFDGHCEPIHGLDFSPDGRLLCSTSFDGTLKIWPVHERRRAEVGLETAQFLWNGVFAPGDRVISESQALEITAWDATVSASTGAFTARATRRELSWSEGGTAHDFCLLSPDGRWAAVTTPRRTVRCVPAPEPGVEDEAGVFETEAFAFPVFGLGFSADSTVFAAADLDLRYPHATSRVRVWLRGGDDDAWRPAARFETAVASPLIVVLPERRLLALGGRHETPVEIRSLATGALVATLPPRGYVPGLVASPDGEHLLTLGAQGDIEFWELPESDVARGGLRRALTVRAHRQRIQCAAFFPDGRMLATAATAGEVRLWRIDKESGTLAVHESIRLIHPQGEIKSLAVRPDGNVLLAAGGAGDESSGWLHAWFTAEAR